MRYMYVLKCCITYCSFRFLNKIAIFSTDLDLMMVNVEYNVLWLLLDIGVYV